MTAEPISDVHVHAHRGDHAPGGKNRTDPEAVSACRPARARVIPLFGRQGQEQSGPDLDLPDDAAPTLGQQLLADLDNGQRVIAHSDLAQNPMNPYQALRSVPPAKGEAGNKLNWMAMTLAGLIRLGGVSIGWLIAQCFATRIRASVGFAALLLGVALSWLAGLESPTT